jgi:hypothetical protein
MRRIRDLHLDIRTRRSKRNNVLKIERTWSTPDMVAYHDKDRQNYILAKPLSDQRAPADGPFGS